MESYYIINSYQPLLEETRIITEDVHPYKEHVEEPCGRSLNHSSSSGTGNYYELLRTPTNPY